jgi:hypothetical protein
MFSRFSHSINLPPGWRPPRVPLRVSKLILLLADRRRTAQHDAPQRIVPRLTGSASPSRPIRIQADSRMTRLVAMISRRRPVLQSEGQMVVTQLPNSFKTQYTDDQTKILAGAVLAALPEIIAYIALQRHFERGMAAGAIK